MQMMQGYDDRMIVYNRIGKWNIGENDCIKQTKENKKTIGTNW